ncbi:MAG: metallophosphoesterase family protein [Candidatus Freyarchaeota archaeon]
MARLFFSVDVHGSELVWRKWLNTPRHRGAKIVLFCGDLTGKSVIPLIKKGENRWTCKLVGRNWDIKGEEEKRKMEKRIRDLGYYPIEMEPEEVEECRRNPKKVEGLFRKLMTERLENWLSMAVENLGKDVTIVCMPGNDDELYIDEVIKKFEKEYENVIYPLDKVVEFEELPGYQMISMEYANPTPWNTPREDSEKGIWKRLEKLAKKVSVDWNHVICSFHCPPYDTRLDLAPRLDRNLKPITVMGQLVMDHVGSKSVRKFMEKYQPLIGLHGHIHESFASDNIGNTVVVNPGSEYMSGVLRGFIIDITPEGGLERYWKVEG